MNVNISHDKLHLKKHPVTITAVYPNISRIEDRTGNDIRQHTIQYVELMMGHVEIVELNRQAQPKTARLFLLVNAEKKVKFLF